MKLRPSNVELGGREKRSSGLTAQKSSNDDTPASDMPIWGVLFKPSNTSTIWHLIFPY